MSLSLAEFRRLPAMLGSGAARPIRFGAVGLITFGVQMGCFAALHGSGLSPVISNAIALAIAVQFNFAANQLFVWADQPVTLLSLGFVRRWIAFHGFLALSLAVNFSVFVVAQLFLPPIIAVMLGIGSSTAIKFVSLDRYAFRS